MKYASVCSGVEAATLAWMPLGWEAAWFSEIEPFPCAVLAERFPGVPNLGDMTKIEVENMENGDQKFSNGNGADVVVPGGVDLLVGGTPCQGFSVAGKQGGLRDDRSVLCLTFVRLLETMRPRWFVWENVPGVFSTGGGEDFRAFLRAIDEVGYSCAWRVLDAQYVRVDGYPRAVPQRRRRVFVIGHSSGDWRYPASILFEPDSLFGDTPPRRVKGKGFTVDVGNRTSPTGWNPAVGRNDGRRDHGICPPNDHGKREAEMSGECAGGDRPLDGYKGESEGFRSSQFGEFVSDTVAGTIKLNSASVGNSSITLVSAHETGQGFWQSGDIAGTLRAEGENRPSRPSNIVCNAGSFMGGQGAKAGGIGYADEIAPTIKASPSGGNQVPDVVCVHGSQDPICNTEHANAVNRNNGLENCVCYGIENGQPCEASIAAKEVSQTLNCMHDHAAVLCYENHAQDSRIKDAGEVSPQLNAKAGTGGNNLPLVQTFTKTAHPQNPEQGQGFAETETAKTLSVHTSPASEIRAEELVAVAIAENTIGRKPHNGGNGTGAQEELAYTQNATGVMGVANFATVRRLTPVECERLMGFPDNWTRIRWKGKSEEDCPDSPRYKACGNSMCVNVMRWIGMRIEIAERKSNA